MLEDRKFGPALGHRYMWRRRHNETSSKMPFSDEDRQAFFNKILRLKSKWVTVLTFLVHVTSSVTWSLFPRYVVSYRWSVDISSLTGTVIPRYLAVKVLSLLCQARPAFSLWRLNGHSTLRMRCATWPGCRGSKITTYLEQPTPPYLPIHNATFMGRRWNTMGVNSWDR